MPVTVSWWEAVNHGDSHFGRVCISARLCFSVCTLVHLVLAPSIRGVRFQHMPVRSNCTVIEAQALLICHLSSMCFKASEKLIQLKATKSRRETE